MNDDYKLSPNSKRLYDELRDEKQSSAQFRAIFLKSLTMQSKMVGTNICQILTPIICLGLVLIIKIIAQKYFKDDPFKISEPILFNLDKLTQLIARSGATPMQMSTCLQWYEFSFDEHASQ